MSATVRDRAHDAVEAAQRQMAAAIQSRIPEKMQGAVTVGAPSLSGATVSGTVAVDDVYAGIQNEGGVVNAKKVQYLTIPIGSAASAAGGATYSAPEVIANPAFGGFTGTFFAKGVLFGKTSYGVEPIFALKRSVTIPGRHYMEAALDAERGAIEERFAEVVAEMAD